MQFVSRAGSKLEFALHTFGYQYSLYVKNKICADLGCSTGGFTDCLIQFGAKKVYSVDTAYGELAWKLRNNPKVVVLERVNAIFLNDSDKNGQKVIHIPEPLDLIVVDVAWTKQKFILKKAKTLLANGGYIISLIKPHYEAEKIELSRGVAKTECLGQILDRTKNDIYKLDLKVVDLIESPIEGKSGGNAEFLALLRL